MKGEKDRRSLQDLDRPLIYQPLTSYELMYNLDVIIS